MDEDVYSKALEQLNEAEKKLSDLLQTFNKLKADRDKLAAFLKQYRELAGMEPDPALPDASAAYTWNTVRPVARHIYVPVSGYFGGGELQAKPGAEPSSSSQDADPAAKETPIEYDASQDGPLAGSTGEELATPQLKNPKKEFVAETCVKILSEKGRPMSRRELYEALQERGIVLHGKDPLMILSTMLWRSGDRIIKLDKGAYWIKGKRLPIA